MAQEGQAATWREMMAAASRRRSESDKGTAPEANMSRRNMSSTQRVDGGGTTDAQSDMALMMDRLRRATESVLVVARCAKKSLTALKANTLPMR